MVKRVKNIRADRDKRKKQKQEKEEEKCSLLRLARGIKIKSEDRELQEVILKDKPLKEKESYHFFFCLKPPIEHLMWKLVCLHQHTGMKLQTSDLYPFHCSSVILVF